MSLGARLKSQQCERRGQGWAEGLGWCSGSGPRWVSPSSAVWGSARCVGEFVVLEVLLLVLVVFAQGPEKMHDADSVQTAWCDYRAALTPVILKVNTSQCRVRGPPSLLMTRGHYGGARLAPSVLHGEKCAPVLLTLGGQLSRTDGRGNVAP